VDAPENAVVAVGRTERTVAGEVRPVAPVLALRILAVLRVVRLHEAIGIFPDRLENARPRIADADVARAPRRQFIALFVVDHGMNPRHARSCASRLHRIERRFRAAEETAGLGLPPRIDDDRFLPADGVVVPAPDFRLDRLAHGHYQLELMVVLERL